LPKEFTIRTYSSDEALVKERRNHIVRCSTKVFTKKGYDRTNAVANKQRKESSR